MQKKLLLVSLAAISVAADGLFAQAATAPSVAITATASVVSDYMFRGQRLNGAGFQPSVEAVIGDVTAGVWANFPIRDKVPDSSDPEFDLYGSYNRKLSDAASLVFGLTGYNYLKAPTNAGFYRWTIEPSLAFNYTVQGFKFTPKYYYDFMLSAATYEITAAYALPLKQIGSELDFTATAGTYKGTDVANNTAPHVSAWGDYWLVGVAAPFQLSKQGKLTVGFAYTDGRNAFVKQGARPKSANSLAMGRGVASVSYAWSF